MTGKFSKAFFLAAAAGLCACETVDLSQEYGPTGGDANRAYGYSEKKNDDGTYILTVRFIFDPRRTKDVMTIWDRRASELCNGAEYEKAIYKSDREKYSDGYNTYPANTVILEGLLTCSALAAADAISAEIPEAPAEELAQ